MNEWIEVVIVLPCESHTYLVFEIIIFSKVPSYSPVPNKSGACNKYITKFVPGILLSSYPVYYQMRTLYITKYVPGILPNAYPIHYQMRTKYITKCVYGILPNVYPVYYQIHTRCITKYLLGILPNTYPVYY